MDLAIPWRDLEGPCKTSVVWRDAVDQVKGHSAHLIACSSGKEPRKVLAWYLTKAIEAVLPTVDSVGVYWGAGTVVMPTELFLEMSKDSSLEFLPLYLWIDFRCYRDKKGGASLFTTGFESLGFMEIEIRNSSQKVSFLVDRAFNLAHYLLDHGPVLKDGHTFGLSKDERIKVRHVKSSIAPGKQVYLLEL